MRFLITGGAGFIGSNAADRLRAAGHDVVVFDNFSRAASAFNRAWLESRQTGIRFVQGDVRDARLWMAIAQGMGHNLTTFGNAELCAGGALDLRV